MAKLVFKTHNADVGTMYEFASILNRRGFILNPKVKGMKMKDTKNIIVDLQEGVYTPYSLKHVLFSDPIKGYFIELKD